MMINGDWTPVISSQGSSREIAGITLPQAATSFEAMLANALLEESAAMASPHEPENLPGEYLSLAEFDEKRKAEHAGHRHVKNENNYCACGCRVDASGNCPLCGVPTFIHAPECQ